VNIRPQHANIVKRPSRRNLSLAWLFLSLASCANQPTNNRPATITDAPSCRAGETAVATATDCLQDEAVCYQLADQSWCTGPYTPSCPAGSVALTRGAECPPNTRCFSVSEGLTCSVSY